MKLWTGQGCGFTDYCRESFGCKVGEIEKEATAKVWVDVENGLPVRIEGDFVDPSDHANIHARYDQFQWNKPIDPKLFALSVPEGFTKEKSE